MKILTIGNYRDLDGCGVSYNTESHLARELEGLGHEVERFQEPPGGGSLQTLRQIEQRVDGCALVLWTRTWGLPPEATDLWRKLEANGTVTASYHLDLYHGLQRGDAIDKDPFWTTGYVFTPDGNEDAAEWFAAHGVNHHWSPPAIPSYECADVMPGTPRECFAHDVVFVGSYGAYHAEWPWRHQLVEWLAFTYGDRFRRYSGDTGYVLDGRRISRPLRGQHLSDLYASAKVVIGDSCFACRDTRYWSDRPFETYGRGGYMLFPAIEALADMIGLYPAYEIGDFDGLAKAIDYSLHDAYARDGSSARLAHQVEAEHTYRVRLGAALDVMGLDVMMSTPEEEVEADLRMTIAFRDDLIRQLGDALVDANTFDAELMSQEQLDEQSSAVAAYRGYRKAVDDA